MASVFKVSGSTITVLSDLSWVGKHKLKIRGQNGAGIKKYNTIDSVSFSIEFIHPCTISVVDEFDFKDMLTTVLLGKNVT
jgi:hypothetical protein